MLSAFTGAVDMKSSDITVMLLYHYFSANGYYRSRWNKCIHSSRDFSDMVFVDNYIFNKDVHIQFNSTVGEFVGYTALGVHNAELWNKDTTGLQQERAQVDSFCKHNAQIRQSAIADKTGEQHKTLISPVT
ncbi:hypothetical protein cypCar_00034708 [Cyprinus carpio]|nr:hypothetical protein cypCar_00034708 [Cyprinus carpio]